jgi:hypothetical protein
VNTSASASDPDPAGTVGSGNGTLMENLDRGTVNVVPRRPHPRPRTEAVGAAPVAPLHAPVEHPSG